MPNEIVPEASPQFCGDTIRELMGGGDASGPPFRDFAVGFIAGQCEKVFHRVCPAACFDPKLINSSGTLLGILERVAKVYGLRTNRIMRQIPGGRDIGYWAYHPDEEDNPAWEGVTTAEVNSWQWHNARAILCGIPGEHLDLKYHERS